MALDLNHAYRWIDPPELESYTGGTFESRIEEDGTRRGFKALTINPRLRFEGRKIRVRVPVNGSIRNSIRCVRYTVLPRRIQEGNERIGDPKEAKYIVESEIRVADGTPIPEGTKFIVMPGAGVDQEIAKALGKRYVITWSNDQQGAS